MCDNCSCATTTDVAAPTAGGTTSTYQVSGMTCGHCVSAVSAEVGAIPGVRDVAVDLASGRVTVASDQPVDEALVKAAVEEAGYELVSTS